MPYLCTRQEPSEGGAVIVLWLWYWSARAQLVNAADIRGTPHYPSPADVAQLTTLSKYSMPPLSESVRSAAHWILWI